MKSAAAFALCLGGLVAQAPTANTDASARLHAAWIREVLDLDVRAAVSEYEAIAHDARPANLERWIAVARLTELQRVGVTGTRPIPLAEAPEPIRTAAAEMQPLPTDTLLQQVRQDPATVLQQMAASGDNFNLRPLTEIAQRWLRNHQWLSTSERQRQRFQALNNRPRQGQPETLRNRWPMAASVLRAELQGQPARAAELRWFDFQDWKAPALVGEPAALLQRARTNLDAWLAETPMVEQQQTLLKGLRDQLERMASEPTASLDLLLRLPLVAERLLAEPKPTEPNAGDGKANEPKPGDRK